MSMSKVIGVILVAAPIVAYTVACMKVYGVRDTLIAWFVVLLMVGLIVSGIFLICR